MSNDQTAHPQQKLIDRLRAQLDFLEQNPQQHFVSVYDETIRIHPGTKEKLAECIRGQGKVTKEVTDDFYKVRKQLGGGADVVWVVGREKACVRKLVGTKTIPAEPEQVITIPAKPERVEEVYAWDCPESLLKPETPAEPLPEPTAEPIPETLPIAAERNGEPVLAKGA